MIFTCDKITALSSPIPRNVVGKSKFHSDSTLTAKPGYCKIMLTLQTRKKPNLNCNVGRALNPFHAVFSRNSSPPRKSIRGRDI